MIRLVQVVTVTIGAPAAIFGLIALLELGVGRLPPHVARRVRPWTWLSPALGLAGVFLAWPLASTIVLSFRDADASGFVGLQNYRDAIGDPQITTAFRNNAIWFAFLIPGTVVLGMVLAVLTDRVRYERAAKTVVFVPMAISFVAAGTIWKFMYDYRPPGSPQTGTVNELWLATGLGSQPRAWLVETSINNVALVLVGIWMLTGFAMVILSAAVKGIPPELFDAARVDGATEWRVFWHITWPLLRPTIVVVATVMFINSIKIFDIVFVLTNGQFETGVLGTEMYRQLFIVQHLGRASVLAVVLLLLASPVMIANVRGFRREGALR
ncbi:MAG: sugar ABC transporter permease [Actinomycetota bacterium]|nr:sugar ABC transporter permease [Actinomycetota bacterium]